MLPFLETILNSVPMNFSADEQRLIPTQRSLNYKNCCRINKAAEK